MLRGAFIGFGNVAANGHLPGWQACYDVVLVGVTYACGARREATGTHRRALVQRG